MPSISGHDYDCPKQTLTVQVDGGDSTAPYRVYGVVVPESGSLPSGDLPPKDAPSGDGSGTGNVPISSSTWPTAGKIKYRVWLLVSGGRVDGAKDCNAGNASSSSSSSSLTSSSSSS